MDDLLLKLRILAKAEVVLFRLHLRRSLRQAAFGLAAVLVLVLAVGMLSLALYQYLLPRLDGALAAVAVAVVDLIIAAALLAAAGRQRHDPEYEAARDLREAIVADLAADAGRLQAQAAELHGDIQRIRATARRFLHPGGIGIETIAQWLVLLARALRRK